jgi:hypothetical protein
MVEPNEMDPIKSRTPSVVPNSGASDDRPYLFLTVTLLLGFLARLNSSRASTSAPNTRNKWLEQWSDDEYIYLETTVPEESFELEFDLNVCNGKIFVRIARVTGGPEISELPAD